MCKLLYKTIVAVFMSTLLISSAEANCENIQRIAQEKETQFIPRQGYRVNGKGRLYFYSAPDEKCRMKGIFVIGGDELIAYSEYHGWYGIMYMNNNTGDVYQGWVRPERLEYTGTMGGGGE